MAVAWLDGDRHCEAGEVLPCLNASGAPRTCLSNTTFPVDVLPLTTTCLKSTLAPACGYTAVHAKCDCKTCIANKQYACECGAAADGTATCSSDGESLSCDCDTPFTAFPPPPAPPPSNSPGGGSPVGAIAGGAVGGIIVLGGAAAFFVRRRRRMGMLSAYNAGLLNSEPVAAVDVADAE